MPSEYIYTLLQPIPHYITCPPKIDKHFSILHHIISCFPHTCKHIFKLNHILLPITENAYTLFQPTSHYIICLPKTYKDL